MKTKHISVLKHEIIKYLNVKDGGVYIDATLGGGGHFVQIIEKLIETDTDTKLIGLDQDRSAIERTVLMLEEKYDLKFENYSKAIIGKLEIILVNENFENLERILDELKIAKVDGIIADLGTSQDQIEDETRGFSYRFDSVLDMRMSENLKVKASDLINVLEKKEMMKLFTNLGDFNFKEATVLTNLIIKRRNIKPVEMTSELVEIINQAVHSLSIGSRTRQKKGNLEARVFQALRIAVNHEYHALKQFLPQAFEALKAQGRLAIISFHSGEDRIVKNYTKSLINTKRARYVKELIRPDVIELKRNPRSESAKLRIIEKF